MMFVLLLFYAFYGVLFFVNVHFHWIPLNIYRLAMVAASIALGSYVGFRLQLSSSPMFSKEIERS